MDELIFDKLTISDGLSQSVVKSIIQDRCGFMWFATEEGLNRFDGYNFRIFKSDTELKKSPARSHINCNLPDRNGDLWFGATNSYLIKYEIVNDRFKNYKIQDDNSGTGFTVNSIVEDESENLYLGSLAGGVYKFNKSDCNFEHLLLKSIGGENLPDNNMHKLYYEGNGKLWIGTWYEGLIIYDLNSRSYEYHKHIPEDSRSISDNRIRFLFKDSSGNMWIGTNRGLNRYDYKDRKFDRFHSDSVTGKTFSEETILCICEDDTGELWIGSRKNGLYRYNYQSDSLSVFKNNSEDTNTISNNFILSLYNDKSNVLWIGTYGSGLNKLDRERKKIFTVNDFGKKFRSVNANHLNAILKDRKGNLWLGTFSKGLIKINYDDNAYSIFNNEDSKVKVNIGIGITSLTEDKHGNIYAGSRGGGLIEYSASENKFHNYFLTENISETEFYCLLYDEKYSEDYLFAGTLNYGVYKFSLRDKIFTQMIPGNLMGEFRNTIISWMTFDKTGNLLIATNSKGLFKLDSENKIFRILIDDNNSDKEITQAICYIYTDSKNNYWIGTYANGLFKYDNTEKSFYHLTLSNGLNDKNIKGILEDNEGNIWISTGSGISRIDPVNYLVKNFFYEDGLQSKEFNSMACFKSEDGILYFGGINGFNYFKPGEIKINFFIPDIIVTDFKIFNESVNNSEDNPFIKKNISETKEINLTYRESVFSFEFAALIFNNPGRNEYAYMMSGFDKEWVYCGNRRQATYTNLDPGEYLFRVKGSNNDGIWNEEGTSIKIYISPPFWKTWWFKSLGLMSLAGATSLAYQQKLTKVKKENKLQQEFSRRLIDTQEKERKNIASELHDTIAHDILITKNKIATGIQQTESIEIKSLLNEISELSSNTLNDVRNISHNLSPHILEELGLTKAIKSIIRKVTQTSELIFTESIENIDSILSKELEINIYRIIQECINNIFKHSGATEANLKIMKENEIVKLIITDNGKGISDENKKGFGMKGLNERIKLYKGNLNIDTGRERGTRLTISFPLKNPNIEQAG